MRAVFLGTQNAGDKRECAGTGVFLPRQIGTQSETSKKTGCSIVLVPARVVQALKLLGESKSSWRTDEEVMSIYEGWLAKHGKAYNGLGEKERRFQIFKDNLSYKLGLNSLLHRRTGPISWAPRPALRRGGSPN